MEALFDRLWPILRSITGAGVRETLAVLDELIALERIEVPSGTRVLDWTVPPEWVVRDAYVVTPAGDRILDVHENNLHLVNYSVAFGGTLTRAELDEHLHSLPEQPQAIPYVTSYYEPRWGFCIAQRDRDALPDGDYEVVVDTAHVEGSLTLAEAVLPGGTPDEVLISTYTCHPSLANNELSGPIVAAFLARRVAQWPQRRLTYRFAFVPETIGAIAYLARVGEHLTERLRAGYVVTCAGDPAPFTLKLSRRGDSDADRAALAVLRARDPELRVRAFFPSGSDERQYCSPGFNLPVASVMRSMYGTYPEYHTSLDDRDFISFAALAETIDAYEEILLALERNATYVNLVPRGEPQLGRRGLYPTLGSKDRTHSTAALRWLLNLSDGEHDLLAIAERSGQRPEALHRAAVACLDAGLLERAA